MQKSMETEQHVYIDISEANIHRWRNDRNSVFSCKVTQSALQDQERKIPQVDEAVLCFVCETHIKGLPFTSQAMQWKAGEIAKNLGIDATKFKAVRGWCDRSVHRAGPSLRQQTLFCPKAPANIQQKTVVEHPFKKCCLTGALGDTRVAVVWKSDDTHDCDSRTDSEELDSEYEVAVIT